MLITRWKFYAAMLLLIIAAVGAGFLYLTKDGAMGQYTSHVKSAFVGLDRTAEVYNYGTSTPVKTYKFKSQVEYKNGATRFLADGKTVNITGGLVIIEEQ